MKRSVQSKLLAAVLALASIGATAAASAGTTVYFAPGSSNYAPPPPVVQLAPQPLYVQHREIAVGEPYPGRYDPYRRDRGDRCGAARWNPQVRYLPGNLARHHGKVYAATRISARVYNVNSPPEVTPQYWVRVRCN
ncbi:hypothetical protein [Caenimonas aquaedulcis]|uniref:Uncharacterized protein n=1 Tax=Caenimonas aquaedulcis TaxID=2793270 RepID=A0A931H7T6_9BURK|nr:hypothetical protein [Caenimonas aquaedulcis]MBG9390291.1 hypothetical protein [Caenimonas aquaedulcis]